MTHRTGKFRKKTYSSAAQVALMLTAKLEVKNGNCCYQNSNFGKYLEELSFHAMIVKLICFSGYETTYRPH